MAAEPVHRWTYTPNEVAELTGIPAQTVRAMCHDGRIRTVRHGARYYVPRAELQRMTGEASPPLQDEQVSSRPDQTEKIRALRRLAAEISVRQAELDRLLADLED